MRTTSSTLCRCCVLTPAVLLLLLLQQPTSCSAFLGTTATAFAALDYDDASTASATAEVIRVQQEAARLLDSVGLLDQLCHPYRRGADLLLPPELFPLCGGGESPTHTKDQRILYEEYDEASEQQSATSDEERKMNQMDTVIDIVGTLVCVVAGALAAGLTIGLLSLDPLLLLIKSRAAGTAAERQQASQILPVIRQHHRLLVTLLLMNTAASEALPIFLHGLVPEYAAVLISIVLVLLFGEILPSAVFTGKNQIAMAARWVGAVQFLLWLFWPVAYPISRLLDWVLGDEHGASDGDKFNRGELAALVRIQYEERMAAKQRRQQTAHEAAVRSVADLNYTASRDSDSNNNSDPLASQQHPMMMGGSTRDLRQSLMAEQQQQQRASFANRAAPALPRGHHHRRHSSSILMDEVNIVEGALQMKTKNSFDLLVQHRKVYSVSLDTILNEANIVKIFASGYSRVPVYCDNQKTRIKGILLTRQLIVVNKNESVPLRELPLHIPQCVSPGTNLVDLVNLFQTGGNGRGRGGHMALVCARPDAADAALERDEPLPESAGWMGIVTLEDCLEALLQEQILDEQDAAGRLAPVRTMSTDDHNADGGTVGVQNDNHDDDNDDGVEQGSSDGSIQLV